MDSILFCWDLFLLLWWICLFILGLEDDFTGLLIWKALHENLWIFVPHIFYVKFELHFSLMKVCSRMIQISISSNQKSFFLGIFFFEWNMVLSRQVEIHFLISTQSICSSTFFKEKVYVKYHWTWWDFKTHHAWKKLTFKLISRKNSNWEKIATFSYT